MSNVASSSVLYMSMSLDGYISGPNDGPDNPGGDDFDRLHEWILTPDGKFGRPSGPAGELWDEWNETGAVLVGRQWRRSARSLGRRSSWCPDLRSQSPATGAVGGELSA